MIKVEEFIPVVQTSETNRPLNESNDDPAFTKRLEALGVNMRTQIWRFGGSREGYLYKGPAMAEIVRSFPDELNDFALYHYLATGGNGNGRSSTVKEVQAMADIGLALPFYLFNRAHNPIKSQGELPAHIAGGFKVCSGFMKGIKDMRTVDGDDMLRRILSPEQYYDEFERVGGLIDKAGFACAAPKVMIDQAAEALVNGNEEGMKESRLLQDPDLDLGDLLAFTPLYNELRNHIYAFTTLGKQYTAALVNKLQSGDLTQAQLVRLLQEYRGKEAIFQEKGTDLLELITPTLGYPAGTEAQVTRADIQRVLPVGPRRVVRARFNMSLEDILR